MVPGVAATCATHLSQRFFPKVNRPPIGRGQRTCSISLHLFSVFLHSS